jgi:hypothetical protein
MHVGMPGKMMLSSHDPLCLSFCCLLPLLLLLLLLQIFVEIERARLTRKLAAMREAEGNIAEAADILQEVAVVSSSWLQHDRGTSLLSVCNSLHIHMAHHSQPL